MTATEAAAGMRGRNALLLLFLGSGCAALIYEVVWYQALALVIALFGLLVLYVLPWAGGLYTAVGGGGFSGILLRGLFCALFLLAPTMAMGATLPAAASWLRSTLEGVSRAGFYYAANIAG